MGGAEETQKTFIVAEEDGERSHVVDLKAGPRAASCPVRAPVFTLMTRTSVDPLDDLGGNVAGLGGLVVPRVFHNLVRRRWPLAPFPAFELLLGVLFLEGDVESFLDNLGHVLLSVLDTQDFGQPFELVFEVAVGREPEVEFVWSRGP